jgi:hypothetical protein
VRERLKASMRATIVCCFSVRSRGFRDDRRASPTPISNYLRVLFAVGKIGPPDVLLLCLPMGYRGTGVLSKRPCSMLMG